MKPLKLDEVWRLLPELEELRPLVELMTVRSNPDPDRTWSAAGALDTAADRTLDADAVEAGIDGVVQSEAERLAELFTGISRALGHLASGNRIAAAQAFLDLARLEEERDRPGRAESFARTAWEVSRDETDRRTAALALRRWARAARARGDLSEALTRYREARVICEATREYVGAAEASIGAGNVLEERGLWEEAETWYRKALQHLDEVDDPIRPERWHALLNLHIAQRSRGLIEESREFLAAAEEVANELKDPNATVFLENAHGQLRMAEGRFEEAERRFRSGLHASASSQAQVMLMLNLSECLLARDRTLEAADMAREAERVALAGRRIPALPEIYRLLGRIAAVSGNRDAFVLFERAVELIGQHDLPKIELARTLQAYAESEAARGDMDAARHLHEEARRHYADLGITANRHPWTEVFDASPRDVDQQNG